LAEIEAGIAEVDKGEFAEPAEVARVIAKFMAPLRST
jgi:predicted transcriptional regulator